jgi:hypothetical protein
LSRGTAVAFGTSIFIYSEKAWGGGRAAPYSFLPAFVVVRGCWMFVDQRANFKATGGHMNKLYGNECINYSGKQYVFIKYANIWIVSNVRVRMIYRSKK